MLDSVGSAGSVQRIPVAAIPKLGSLSPHTAAYREALAKKIVSEIGGTFAKLATHKAEIAELWVEFGQLVPGETILGCSTKKEFCEKHLGRTYRRVRQMLAGARKPSTQTLSRERRLSMWVASGDKLLANDPVEAKRIGQHYLDLASGGIVERGLLLKDRGLVTRVLDFVTRRAS